MTNNKKAATEHGKKKEERVKHLISSDDFARSEADFLGSAEWETYKDGADNVIRTLLKPVNILDSTAFFMQEAGQLVEVGFPSNIKDPTRILRRKMLADAKSGEVGEYLDAEFSNDIVEVADGLADVIVVSIGTLYQYFGIECTRELLAEVARSNEDKINGKHGPTVFHKNGKVAKPDGWVGPDLRPILEKYGHVQPAPEFLDFFNADKEGK